MNSLRKENTRWVRPPARSARILDRLIGLAHNLLEGERSQRLVAPDHLITTELMP